MNWLRMLPGLLLAASAVLAGDLPSRPMPQIDGRWSGEEWARSSAFSFPGGEARVHLAGRALCVGIRLERPYQGERIDLYWATKSGGASCTHQLHPACFLPRIPYAPLPPILVRKGPWASRLETNYASAYASRFRAVVLRKDERSWTAEFAVALEALDLPAGEPLMFHVRVVRPFSREDVALAKAPADWSPVSLAPDPKAKLFETPREDDQNKIALELFREARKPSDGPLQRALDREFSLQRVDRLIAACGAETFHGQWYRLHLLRRSNRLALANGALRKLLDTTPLAARLTPVAAERRQLLLLGHEYGKLRDLESARWIDTVDAAWSQEQALRARDAKDKALPQIVFETTAGEVKVALYQRDAPALCDAVRAFVKGGKMTDARCIWATGGVGAAFEAPTAPDDTKPSGRRAWRGSLALVSEKDGKLRLLFTTGQVHLYRSATAIGRIIEGQEFVDRLGSDDTIRAAREP